MIRQYHTSPFRGGCNPLRVGTIATGTIFHLTPLHLELVPDRYGIQGTLRTTPWIVEAFLNGTMGAAARNAKTGRWEERTISGRSDRAVIRSLATGKRRIVMVRHLILWDERDCASDGRYPDLPDVARFHGAYRRAAVRALGRGLAA